VIFCQTTSDPFVTSESKVAPVSASIVSTGPPNFGVL
jgi:hypothetical protein